MTDDIHLIYRVNVKSKLQPKPKTIDELKVSLQIIMERADTRTRQQGGIANFTKRLTAYMAVASNDGCHFEHL